MCARMHACVHVCMHVCLCIEFLGAEVTSCKLPDNGFWELNVPQKSREVYILNH